MERISILALPHHVMLFSSINSCSCRESLQQSILCVLKAKDRAEGGKLLLFFLFFHVGRGSRYYIFNSRSHVVVYENYDITYY